MTAGILDQIIESQQQELTSQTNPHALLQGLIGRLRDRERDVLLSRFALQVRSPEPKTLKEIGDVLGVTRERVRQIELAAIKKMRELKSHQEFTVQSEALKLFLRRILEENGGIMEREHLLTTGLGMLVADVVTEDVRAFQKSALSFLIDHLFDDVVEAYPGDEQILSGWKLSMVDHGSARKTIAAAKGILENHGEPMEFDDLVRAITAEIDCEVSHCGAHLHLSCHIRPNAFRHWGLSHWVSVTPKRINDKIYLILTREGKPMHFTDIAKNINAAKFDDKLAHPSTVHNELISDKRYVLVGRGMYALSSWGYVSGVVSDVIARLMLEAGKPLSKQEIVEGVLAQRLVRKSTVLLALTDQSKFTRIADRKYTLATAVVNQ